jgi:LPPG:FO 2-phospho-L-lactate transferase
VVRDIRYEGAALARPSPAVLEALSAPTLAGIIICPSNPWLSVEPILAVAGMREALKASGRPIVAVSPIIAGKAVKGPAAKIMGELGLDADSRTIAWHYEGLIDGLIIDTADEALAANLPMPAIVTNTMMRTLDDKVALARQCLAFCERLSRVGKAKAAR